MTKAFYVLKKVIDEKDSFFVAELLKKFELNVALKAFSKFIDFYNEINFNPLHINYLSKKSWPKNM
ncbi:hypothetical protein N9348_02330 [Gammaproteobacteria bacterium]|nr:hypothetical protein [Gammaproteobacteria bacterium]